MATLSLFGPDRIPLPSHSGTHAAFGQRETEAPLARRSWAATGRARRPRTACPVEGQPRNDDDAVREWRCGHCEMLLGTERDGKLYIKVKKTQLVIQGSIAAVCD